jgi:hypothetical protein
MKSDLSADQHKVAASDRKAASIQAVVGILTSVSNCSCGKPASIWVNAAPHAASGGSMVPKCAECNPYRITGQATLCHPVR